METDRILGLLKKYIKSQKRTTIELDSLSEFISEEYLEVFHTVKELEGLNYLEPVKKSETNKRPNPLYKKYRINIEDSKYLSNEEKSAFLHEINFSIYSKFIIDDYKENLVLYIKHREHLMMLSDYYKQNRQYLNIECSINERSYEIFNDEKFLKENPLANEILKTIDLKLEDLNVYYTPEPFFYYSVNQKSPYNILIVENKDTFYTMKKLLSEGKYVFFGVEFSSVIFGEGKKIESSFEDILYNKSISYFNKSDNEFYYWGDIDREGMRIYQNLEFKYKGFNIKLFADAYYKMLELAKGINKSKNPQKVKPKGITALHSEACKKIGNILEEDKYVPQEILSYRILREV